MRQKFYRHILLLLTLILTVVTAQADNEPATPQVNPKMIRIQGKVFGGACQANVGKTATVVLAADNFDILIDSVFGGNDVSGTIGADSRATDDLPDVLEQAKENGITTDVDGKKNTELYNAFVHIAKEKKEDYHIFIGNLFGGGNGDYDYTTQTNNPYYGMTVPTVSKVYVEILGGTIAYLYGGGNKATVTRNTDICIDNDSHVTTAMPTGATGNDNLLTSIEVLHSMGIQALGSNAIRDTYHFSRVFGGNNKAPMDIRPTWHLKLGGIDNLYSGGNEGKMTHPGGILLDIPENSNILVNNVYGGCRKADVDPMENGVRVTYIPPLIDNPDKALRTYSFPENYAAHTIIHGGQINNVYGGNDISGKVYFGNAVGINTSINGDVYGGGNGSYPYTDNDNLIGNIDYGDYYYEVPSGKTSAAYLTEFRPNAEQVSIHLGGKDADHPTIIRGSIYVGGNSATLIPSTTIADSKAELKIGSYVFANEVFLGNNGANMVKCNAAGDELEGVLRTMKKYVNSEGQFSDTEQEGYKKFNSMDLTQSDTFKEYMKGCAMTIIPNIVFDGEHALDRNPYVNYTSFFGSIFCGGNRGSLIKDGLQSITFEHQVVVFDKLVGGCNNAYIPQTDYNAEYKGGVMGQPDASDNKIKLNISGLRIEPKRWKTLPDTDASGYADALAAFLKNPLEWNTFIGDTKVQVQDAENWTPKDATADDLKRRFQGGNVYGGCCTSGIVNGNIILNINGTVMDRNVLFDKTEFDDGSLYGGDVLDQSHYTISERRTGVILGQQGMDVFGSALNVFGGGKGKTTEVWGSTTINMNKGYVFQIFGGSEEGVIGESREDLGETPQTSDYVFNGKHYKYSDAYSCYINAHGTVPGKPKSKGNDDNLPECEFIYGGGFEGPIAGNTVIRLGNCRIFNSFAGSCAADILGHTETYLGYSKKDGVDVSGFPYVRDYVYAGNDLGGEIKGVGNFSDSKYIRVASDKIYDAQDLLNTSTYVEYRQGYALGLFGGCYGTYDYINEKELDENGNPTTTANPFYQYRNNQPFLNGSFVNFRPESTDALKSNEYNMVAELYGSGQGHPHDVNTDKMQNRSYLLIDIPQDMVNYQNMKVFGAGAWSGLGINGLGVKNAQNKDIVDPYDNSYKTNNVFDESKYKVDADKRSAVIDLVRGQIASVYGGAYREGVTRRTVVNVPAGSTIQVGSIFGGAFGTDTYAPCDVYESNVNFKSSEATLLYNPKMNSDYTGAIYGGNNNERRTIYSRVYVSSPIKQIHVIQYDEEIDKYLENYPLETFGTVYGAGRGSKTWAEYTLVDLKPNAKVYEAYGGGQKGMVYSGESVQNFITNHVPDRFKNNDGSTKLEEWHYAWNLGGDYDDTTWSTPYWQNPLANLQNPLVRQAEVDDRSYDKLGNQELIKQIKERVYQKYNTNVIIENNATVTNYVYGGGLGTDAVISGSTYVALLGGEVYKDIYAAGTSGSVEDLHRAEAYYQNELGNYTGDDIHFKVSATAYIGGGTVRNVYGGGWRGSVGHHGETGVHNDDISDVVNNTYDVDGESHVVIGKLDGNSHSDGIPSVTRNVYGGGEGGAIYGDAYVRVNNGYIGFRYNPNGTDKASTTDINEKYEPELDDAEPGDKKLDMGGNVFGGGYVANSYVDRSHVEMFGGIVRGSLYGGGEVGPIGRGTVHAGNIAAFKEKNPSIWENYVKHRDSEQPAAIYKGGSTEVKLWRGLVMRDVFGGGRGYDNWGGEGWMTDEEKETMDKSSKGYVFGSTRVYIHGGEVGTNENVVKGYGNVFGGGNEGFVYSAKGTKKGNKGSTTYSDGMPTDGGGYYYVDNDISKGLTLDCSVTVEPYCMVTDNGGITIGSTLYKKDEYVPVESLNRLKNKNAAQAEWAKLNIDGVKIHNSLFAGGNITEGSDKLFANTITVYGNAAASVRDAYNLDLISLGTEEMGGLYGDGNLTLVDGFREIHIDNYGTDFYSLPTSLSLVDYDQLSDRQKAYYKLKYVANVAHDFEYYECQHQHDYHEVSYRKGQKISEDDYTAIAANDDFATSEKDNWRKGKKSYKKDEQIEEGEYNLMYDDEKARWTLFGVTSIYAGRPMNTVQRADMCGVFGSRLVLKGAVDRAPQVDGGVDYNSYTINRVGEVSLNKRKSQADDTDEKNKEHGNYFGIYNSVKFLGNLTSDVFFTEIVETTDDDGTAIRKTDTDKNELKADGTTTYYKWKNDKPRYRYRNNGISHNKVALASGVYLEIKQELGETTGKDEWGYITGVVELDLINVMQGMGGGYVYARNEHGSKTFHSNYGKLSLLTENAEARTFRHFTYSEPSNLNNLQLIETSGNFVHNTKQIVDDCYPNSGIYNDLYKESPAHYWFIKGSIYVYDQYISAYTGSATATAERQEIPLTISAASNGKLTLCDVKPNLYAFYDKNGNKLGSTDADTVLVVNNTSYKLNQPISYWNYNLLTEGEKALFESETYFVLEDCKIGNVPYKKGTVLLKREYDQLKGSGNGPAVTYTLGDNVKNDGVFTDFFRPSNNLSHDTGYVLTYDVNNPMVWNNYYTKTTDPGQANALNTEQYTEGKDKDNHEISKIDYTEGPTYSLKPTATATVYGQLKYSLGSIVFGKDVTNYNQNVKDHITDPTTQAELEEAYVVTKAITAIDKDNIEHELIPGVPIYRSQYVKGEDASRWNYIITENSAAEKAQVCTSLLQFSTSDYVWSGKILSNDDIDEMIDKVITKNDYKDIPGGKKAREQAQDFLKYYIDDAWYCTKAGKYGGIYFEPGKAYRTLDTWCSMSEDERENFEFNYDALDLLIDPSYSGETIDYDGSNSTRTYSDVQPIDYQAQFVGYKDENGDEITSITYTPKTGSAVTINKSTSQSDWLSREAYEAIPNEKRHYSPIIITEPGDYYMVKEPFMDGEVPYTTGQQIDTETYSSLSDKSTIDVFTFTDSQANTPTTVDGKQVYEPKTYYYCYNSYKIDEKGEGKAITTTAITKNNADVSSTTYNLANPNAEPPTTDAEVPQGVVIDKTTYDGLCNFQRGFTIHGTSPTEVSTLYVSNESDIHNLSKEKIISVIYLYEYEESDESGLNVTPVSERHILNIHINFKSGVPEIGEIQKPDLVLPGTSISMNIPSVTEGAYRVTDAGWEVFENSTDADTHYNGKRFYNNETPLYLYQNNYWIAYYAQTVLGKTYSKPVPLRVANYHDLKKVMDDKEHHYYIDHSGIPKPKIYINDYSESNQNGLDLLSGLIDLTYGKTAAETVYGELDNRIQIPGGHHLEFFMRTDIDYNNADWTPIANGENECFSGTLHGDGHYISNLKGSLFNQLCGSVYNLGVSGSFSTAGIADTGDGYMENCWVKTTGTPAADTYPLFGHPNATLYSQVVNCYYMGEYKSFGENSKNMATKKDAKAFYNGEVAYNLNGFYLYKRYCDHVGKSRLSGTPMEYQYWAPNETTPQKGYYDDQHTELCSSGYNGVKYVENRYADGDFIYAAGTIPGSVDERAQKDEKGNIIAYYPKWPEDYLFFGQTLNYGHVENVQHDDLPLTFNVNNHVYRAPAYYGNKTMGVAHFNADAVFAQTKKDDTSVLAYKGLTAIDFSGGNGDVSGGYKIGTDNDKFYAPLLDDNGLNSFNNVDLTRNLLVYTALTGGTGENQTPTASQRTANVVSVKLHDAAFNDYETNNTTYHTVAAPTEDIRGHWVYEKAANTYEAMYDHFLVDKQDFNAPIAYKFADGKRMWYQRLPDNYVGMKKTDNSYNDRSTGWEGVSLPFTAELVTTDVKGEITHFYNSGDNWKGHEYWLREFNSVGDLTDKTLIANFYKPEAGTGTKSYTNTFLWDYYYSNLDRNDLNTDQYPDATYKYYSEGHTYTSYPFLKNATPYIIGFPGERYYEFDLSGNFYAQTALITRPLKLNAQLITFASATGSNILVSDVELQGVTKGNYTFKPNYASTEYKDDKVIGYVLNADGSSYTETNAGGGDMIPFRPYFTSSTKVSAPERPRYIVFSGDDSGIGNLDDDDPANKLAGELTFSTKPRKLIVTSSLRQCAEVRVFNVSGVAVAAFTIEPGETIETNIPVSGVYIIKAANGRYTKKLTIQ